MSRFLALAVVSLACFSASAQRLQLALLKYNGGGDWYANPTALPNLARFCNRTLGLDLAEEYATVDVGSPALFTHAFTHLTGHGNIVFSAAEAENLRNYLAGGGFLHVDDNYGLDPFIRPAMKQVFPELTFVELPFDHPVYRQTFQMARGLPKIHKHDEKPAQGFGLIYRGRLVCFYSFETDLGDGWEDADVHNDTPEARESALRMGANLVEYAFTQGG